MESKQNVPQVHLDIESATFSSKEDRRGKTLTQQLCDETGDRVSIKLWETRGS